MIKNILYVFSIILLTITGFLIYDWYQAEPNNKEPLPALLTLISTIVLTIIAWRLDKPKIKINKKDTVQLKNIDESFIDISHKDNTDIFVNEVSNKSKVSINKKDN